MPLTFTNYFPENSTVYEIMCIKYGATRQDACNNTIWRMLIACLIPKVMNMHSEYVIFMTKIC